MKKTFLLAVLSVLSFGLYAKPQIMPDWVQNYRKVFPNSQYLAQRGSGNTAEKAKARLEGKKLDAQEAQTKAAVEEAEDLASYLM